MFAVKSDTAPRWKQGLGAFLRDERASTATEYALIAATVSVLISAVVVAIGAILVEDYYQPVAESIPSK